MAKYSPQTWTDGSGGGTPVSAARLTVVENGIREASMGRSTTFPSSPVDGDIHVYPADTTNGVMWMFMYRSAVNDWEFIGGSPLTSYVATDETSAATAYTDLATVGPSVTLPAFVGDWLVQFSCECYNSNASPTVYAALKRGAAATSDNDSTAVLISTAAGPQHPARSLVVTGMAASAVLKLQYRTTANTGAWRKRMLSVWPIRYTP